MTSARSPGLREARGEVDRGRRLADAALLVREARRCVGRTLSTRGPGRGVARRADASSRRPARRGKPGGVGATFAGRGTRACDSTSSAAELRRDRRDGGRVGARADPEHAAPPVADERQAPLRRDRRLRERLRHARRRSARAAAPRRGPRRRAAFGSSASTVRGSRTCAAPPRAASPRGPGARPRAGSRASRRPSRRRRSGRRSRATSVERPQRVVEQHAPRLRRGRGSRSARASRGAASSQRLKQERDDDDSGSAPCPRSTSATPANVLQPHVDDLALDRRHRLELHRSPESTRLLRRAQRERLERRLRGARGSPPRRR